MICSSLGRISVISRKLVEQKTEEVMFSSMRTSI